MKLSMDIAKYFIKQPIYSYSRYIFFNPKRNKLNRINALNLYFKTPQKIHQKKDNLIKN